MEKYDPNKNYKWTPEDKFEFGGEEFGRILNSFRAILGTQEAQNIVNVYEANRVMETKMKEYVEKGVIKEQEPPQAVPSPPTGAKMEIKRK